MVSIFNWYYLKPVYKQVSLFSFVGLIINTLSNFIQNDCDQDNA
jgi:hypothetical protein